MRQKGERTRPRVPFPAPRREPVPGLLPASSFECGKFFGFPRLPEREARSGTRGGACAPLPERTGACALPAVSQPFW